MSTADGTRDSHRALIVEDDAAIRRLVTKLLTRRGIDTDAVSDGQSAIARLDAAPYSVVVLDLMLPDMDGFAVLAHMKSKGLRMPVAVVSAVSHQALTRLDLDVVKVVISKPFDVDEFTRAIASLCDEQSNQ